MILHKFLDKTIEAAKQSAMQMYGNDLSALKSILQDTDDKNEEDRPGRHRENEENERLLPAAAKPGGGVTFERSEKKGDQQKSTDVESKLTAIRAYAARQTASDINEINGWKEPAVGALPSEKSSRAKNPPDNPATKQVYSRKDLRGPGRAAGSAANNNTAVRNNRSTGSKKKEESGARDGQPFRNVAKTRPGLASNSRPKESSGPGAGEKESPLLQRLDRLESLMHLTLSSADLSHASHPAYHKLLHKGVPKRLISDWFHTLSNQGIHPGEQQKLFNSKLSNIICEVITKAKARSGGKLLFFMGRSGTGKTHLIMKLSQHPRLMADKKIAVASLEPPAGTNHPYYTILAPFCRDRDLPYYRLRAGTTADAMIKEWKQFDHILIDTPSVEKIEENSFEQLMEVKDQLKSAYSSETHYVVNTAVNGVAFHDPLAARTESDHFAFTHIDKSDRWGQTVQLIAQTDYSLRFISSGETIPDDFDIFDPERFAENLLN